jgi:5-methylcytosine-specific restriction endonuclease McrA
VKNHTKIYFKHFGHKIPEDVLCECCSSPSTDIHHVNGRGEGKDVIENLMALCRECHTAAHTNISKKAMQKIHDDFMKNNSR